MDLTLTVRYLDELAALGVTVPKQATATRATSTFSYMPAAWWMLYVVTRHVTGSGPDAPNGAQARTKRRTRNRARVMAVTLRWSDASACAPRPPRASRSAAHFPATAMASVAP